MLLTWAQQPLSNAIAGLFASGEKGWWFDNSRLDTIWQDAAKTTPGALEAPVGYQLDLSGRGNHRSQSTSANRPKLSCLVNLLLGTASLSTQSVTTVAAGYTLYFTGSGSVTLSGTGSGTFTAGTNTFTATAGTLTLTVTGSVLTADLRPTNQATGLMPAYQAVVTRTAGGYDTAGFPTYINYNGSNQFLSTAAIDFTSTAQMTVWAGVRKLSDASFQTICGTFNGSTYPDFVLYGSTSGTGTYRAACDTTGLNFFSAHTTNVFAAPITNVVTMQIDNTQATYSSALGLRVNAAAQTLVDESGGTHTPTNLSNQPAYFGIRGDSALPFSGNEYVNIARGAASNAAQIAAADAYTNMRTRAY